MKIILNLKAIGLALLLQGCGLGDFGEWQITGVSIQKIEGSKKVLCKYDAWGGLDSHAFGYRLMDSSEIFEVKVSKDLPFYDIISIPTNKEIIGLSHKCAKSCGKEYYEHAIPNYQPIEVESIKNSSIQIDHLIYQYKGYSNRNKGYKKYEFNSFYETRDSIFFFNLNDITSKNGRNLDKLSIKKKMVEIQTPKNKDNIDIIIIEDIDIDKNNNELISHKTYHLYPKNEIDINEFTDYGIFKSIKMKTTPNRVDGPTSVN